MEYTLTKEAHKDFVRRLFNENKREDFVLDKLRDVGITAVEGVIGRLLFRSLGIVQLITPEGVGDSDDFADDFMGMEDFNEFYDKWYGEGK